LFVTEDGSGTIWRVSYRKAGTTAETAPSKEPATEGRLSRKGKFGVAQPAMANNDQPPLPERNPVRAGASALKTPPPPGEVPTIPWTDAEVAAAKAKCAEALSSIKLNYEPLAPIKQGLCGAPAPILLKSLGTDPKTRLTSLSSCLPRVSGLQCSTTGPRIPSLRPSLCRTQFVWPRCERWRQ